MMIEEAVELMREALALFADANVPWERSRIGLFGFWIGGNTPPQFDTPLLKAQFSERAWAHLHPNTNNPYMCILKFMSGGGKIIRWENGILDMQLPGGEKFGIPEDTLRKAPRNV